LRPTITSKPKKALLERSTFAVSLKRVKELRMVRTKLDKEAQL
jgi:hypothetical protein